MTVEIRPLGVACNIGCEYCYQEPMRDAGNVASRYDVDKMLAAAGRAGSAFSLFGGEPLLVPKPDLERIWRFGLERFGSNGIQTNGTLIDDEHIELFRRYHVHVGISIDGPGELNDVRSARSGDIMETRRLTERTMAAIARLVRSRITPSLIVTLHRGNAINERLPKLIQWLCDMDDLGIQGGRLHVLESETPLIRSIWGLTSKEYLAAFDAIRQAAKLFRSFKIDVFEELRPLVLGDDSRVSCVWAACDPYTTRAVQGIEGSGRLSNCGRTNKDGVDYVKASSQGFERYVSLYSTPQEQGGCAGCRFFMFCKGQCPGTAIDGDWRNKTEHCELWMTMLGQIESELLQEGKLPLSAHPDRKLIEQKLLEHWARGENLGLVGAIKEITKERQMGNDRARQGKAQRASGAECRPHHGDAGHGDHYDEANPYHQDR
ncbi:MAG: radical SAM protein [Planctomycetota bacterium]|jgi:uncharacterized protein